jgi:fengycin family lipopeptide synthetase D
VALVGNDEGWKGRRVEGKKETISITYKELNERANQLAHYLQSKGVSGTIVGILVGRSINMIVGLLGILKTGGTYLPLDPEYPAERTKYILEKSGTAIVLTQEHLIPGNTTPEFKGEIIDILDENSFPGSKLPLENSVYPFDPAYVIYTSGSTGNPKGVMVGHQEAINFIAGMTARIAFLPGKSILALTTISFDIFFLETLLPLTCGLKVVLAEPR